MPLATLECKVSKGGWTSPLKIWWQVWSRRQSGLFKHSGCMSFFAPHGQTLDNLGPMLAQALPLLCVGEGGRCLTPLALHTYCYILHTTQCCVCLLPPRLPKTHPSHKNPSLPQKSNQTTEKPIPAGTQILHTYGDLSDAQLLQTYGFIDIPPTTTTTTDQQQQQQHEQQQLASNPHNYVVLPVEGLLGAVKTVGGAAQLWPAKKTNQVRFCVFAFLIFVGFFFLVWRVLLGAMLCSCSSTTHNIVSVRRVCISMLWSKLAGVVDRFTA